MQVLKLHIALLAVTILVGVVLQCQLAILLLEFVVCGRHGNIRKFQGFKCLGDVHPYSYTAIMMILTCYLYVVSGYCSMS